MRVHILLLTLLAGTCNLGGAQDAHFDQAIRNKSISADLANSVAQVAWLSQMPVIAELAQPLPTIQIAGGTHSLRYLLDDIVRQAPGYQWEAKGKAVHFYNKVLRDTKFNFLNLRFARFTMPSNLSEFKLSFPEREFGLLQGYSGGGIATIAVGDTVLEKDLLQPTTLENVTGREILLKAANERPTFFSVIVFPNADPTKKQMEQDMNRNWFWQAFKDQHFGSLYVEPAAGTRQLR